MRHQLMPRSAALALASVLLASAPLVRAADQVREPSIGYSVRVTVQEAPIFAAADVRSQLLARVRSKDMLVVLGRENSFYKVRVPRDRKLNPTFPDSGYIEVKRVQVVSGTATGEMGTPAGPGRPAAPAAARAKEQAGAQGWTGLQLRPFGEFAFQVFTASESFKAIFGNSTGVFYGGGVDMALSRALRFNVAVTHFQKTGERAFAYNGESFPLGISDRVSMTPITFNVAYRFAGKRRYTPYIGGGAGAVVYRETSDFANEADDVNTTGTAFQVLGGVEFPLGKAVSLAVEGQYQGVSGILGDSGVSQAFNEKDAGGFSVRARILFGK